MSLSHDETRRRLAENYGKLEIALDLIVKAQDDITLAKLAIVRAEEDLVNVKADIELLKPASEPVEPK